MPSVHWVVSPPHVCPQAVDIVKTVPSLSPGKLVCILTKEGEGPFTLPWNPQGTLIFSNVRLPPLIGGSTGTHVCHDSRLTMQGALTISKDSVYDNMCNYMCYNIVEYLTYSHGTCSLPDGVSTDGNVNSMASIIRIHKIGSS